ADALGSGEIDILIVGGGTAGAALAGIIARDTDRAVVLLEAGPDYGPLSGGGWPAGLLDARHLPKTHDWGYHGLAHPTHENVTAFDRARVIGGSSAHNGCVALLGHRRDYDDWAALGNTGWGWEAVAPSFERAKQGLRVRLVDDHALTPFHAAFIDGAVAAGIPRVRDMNDPDDDQGVAASPVNIADGIRWNTSLGYLDPVRDRPNLRIVGDALVDRVEVESGRAVAVQAVIGGEYVRIPAARIVLAAGAYGSPAILLRSGIGPADDLRAIGIDAAHPLPGVGNGLMDHPTVKVHFAGTERLHRAMDDCEARQWRPDEQSLAKARSSRCTEAFDLHLYSVVTHPPGGEGWIYRIYVSSVLPRSAGTVKLAAADPNAPPLIDHGYLSDLDGEDRAVLADGIALARSIGAAAGVAPLYGEETVPGPGYETRAALDRFIERTVDIYYHPTSTCKMGPTSDPLAVVDPTGKVHGLDGLYICDASIFPTLMRANTNLPAAMVAEHMAAGIGG
ncbi:MAG: GMC family oxidoreductase N-terminal domain-containing protein, partial [Thermomicrobia bacterium]|nr:GMC family oxidoreductase N-terminal domain-containing protein [Thermomicrobia bacterium]